MQFRFRATDDRSARNLDGCCLVSFALHTIDNSLEWSPKETHFTARRDEPYERYTLANGPVLVKNPAGYLLARYFGFITADQ